MAEYQNMTSEVSETVIGAQTKFKGNVNTDKPIIIDGIYEGEIDSTDVVIVSNTGIINGEIKCREFHLFGTGEGKVVCTTVADIKPGASFTGDIATKTLISCEGSFIDGSVKMTK